ncbi:MAG: Hpt domain-containing protein, partial [Desulfuromonadales bacterium]|nr:Hpt domain-containing protein [Desulfuromonadales bacterium]
MSSLRDSAFELFLEEAAEHLATLESGLLRLEQEPADGAALEALFRAAHTLKGSAALMKRPLVSTLAHRLEDILEDLQ